MISLPKGTPGEVEKVEEERKEDNEIVSTGGGGGSLSCRCDLPPWLIAVLEGVVVCIPLRFREIVSEGVLISLEGCEIAALR